MIEYNYHTEEVPKNMRITQVSGIILNEKKQVLIYQEKMGIIVFQADILKKMKR